MVNYQRFQSLQNHDSTERRFKVSRGQSYLLGHIPGQDEKLTGGINLIKVENSQDGSEKKQVRMERNWSSAEMGI